MNIDLKEKFGKILNKKTIYILGIIGIILLLLPNFTGNPQPIENNEATEEDYCVVIEAKLEKILSEISGVGKVKVMITAKNHGEISLAKDSDIKGDKTIVLSMKGGGEDIKVIKESYPEIQGVIVVAEGGRNAKVKSDITEAVSALLGVETHKIKIFERKI